MLGELDVRVYQRVRIAPSMSPSGNHRRFTISPVHLLLRSNDADRWVTGRWQRRRIGSLSTHPFLVQTASVAVPKSAPTRAPEPALLSMMSRRWTNLELEGPADELYRLADFIDEGGYGQVYRAVGTRSGEVVAVKLLPPDAVEDDDGSFARELDILPSIRHPNVVRVLHAVAGGAMGPYLMMEYLPDGTLAHWLDARRAAASAVPIHEARDLMLQLAQGARAIQEIAVHRDIRPHNILLDHNRPKLADFGIAKRAAARTGKKTFKGLQAPEYMAPESFVGEPNTYKMDVYALGLVFSEICTLQHPLAGDVVPGDESGWRKAHSFVVPRSMPQKRHDLPVPIASVIDRMLAKNPAERPDWDTVVRVLSHEDIDPPEDVEEVLRAAMQQRRAVEGSMRRAAQAHEEREEREAAFWAACQDLARNCDDIARELTQYDEELRLQIVHGPQHSRTYQFNHGAWLSCIFLNPEYRGQEVAGGYVLGAACLVVATQEGPSANLLLIGERPDQSRGRWVGAVFSGLSEAVAGQTYTGGGYARRQAKMRERAAAARMAAVADRAEGGLTEELSDPRTWQGLSDGRQLSGILHVVPKEEGPERVHIVENVRSVFLSLVRAALLMPPYDGLVVLPEETDVGTRHIVLPPRLG